MWRRSTKKCFAVIRSGGERGQVMLEYMLVLLAIVSIFVAILRPELKNLQQKLTDQFAKGVFETDDSGSGYYRFRIR